MANADTLSVALVGPRDPALEALVAEALGHGAQTWVQDLGAVVIPGGREPSVIMLDARGAAQVPPGLSAFRLRHPGIGVIVLASTLDPVVMLELMRAGVTEYLAEPLTRDDLAAAFARVVGRRETPAAGAVFAFVGARGGVGTTTSAVNVAASLASPKQPALLIDMHLAHGDAAVFLGLDARYSLVDAVDNLHRIDATFFRSVVARTAAGVDLLASSTRPITAPIAASALAAVIDFAASQYAYTVLDVPRSDAAALDALDGVTTIVVVANQEVSTVRSAGRIAASLRARYPRTKVMTVINRRDVGADIEHRDIERAVGGVISHQLPSDYRRAVNAVNSGRPLALDNHNALAASFASLARDLAGVAAPARRATGLKSLWGRS